MSRREKCILGFYFLGCIAVGGFLGFRARPLPVPPPPCDCAERLADLDRRCTDAMARQVGLLRSCEMKCPQEEPTP